MGSTPPESPMRMDSVRSPSGQAAFIYPIKSAVSVKKSQTPGEGKPQRRPGSRESSSGVADALISHDQPEQTFKLSQPPQPKRHSSKFAPEDDDATESDDPADTASGSASPRPTQSRKKSQEGMGKKGLEHDDLSDGDMMRRLRLQGDDKDTHAGGSAAPQAGAHVPRRFSTSQAQAEHTSDSGADALEMLTLPRFRHIETDDGHMIVTGREGAIARCEDEPIHIPGAVQSFGCMIVLRENERGDLVVRQCSENTADIIGFTPQYLFSLDSFLDCLDEDQADTLWDNIELLDETDEELTETGPHVFQLTGTGNASRPDRGQQGWKCWCAAHKIHPHNKTDEPEEGPPPTSSTVLEFELVRDNVNPIIHKAPRKSPNQREDSSTSTSDGNSSEATTPPASITTIDSEGTTKVSSAVQSLTTHAKGGLDGMPYVPTPEQFMESTRSSSKPLKALARSQIQSTGGRARRERPRRNNSLKRDEPDTHATGESLDVVGILSQINEQFAAQKDLQSFLKVVVSIVRELTKFSRVMVYQFDEHWNGQVVCELVDWLDTHDLYRGLHFPATDIPKQARDLYLLNKVRLLYDRDQPSARMVCRARSDLETPVDMTHSFLRAMSPIHIKYLANMGVRASMSISIVAFDQLWGLISLHTYGEYGRRVSFPMRQLCRLIGESVSRNIERLSYTRRLSARKLISTLPTDRNPSGYIISNAEDLLSLFDADFGVIAIGSEAKILGPLSASQEVLAVTEYFRLKKFQSVITSQDVGRDFPDMSLPVGLEVLAGVLLIPLSSSGIDFIAFLRKAQTRHVNWAGKPFKEGKEKTAVLEPRKSFKIWSERVVGTCRAWKDEELETASVLCLVYGKFISVWRQREQAMQYNQLNKLLLSNATHEVRTPLNHIINYLEMALDNPLDEDTRENLNKSHMASKSLLFVINDLLDLTRHEEGNRLFLEEPFDLSATVRESLEMHLYEAKRRKINFTMNVSPEKCYVVGDSARVRQIIVNTVSNSIKYTESGQIHFEMRQRTEAEITSALPNDSDMEIELSISDTGTGIPRERLESIFREFEQVESVIADPSSREGSSEMSTEVAEKTSSDTGIGLGLAIVARIVKNIGGQLRVDSTVGEGSRFTYFLPFRSSTKQDALRSGGARADSHRSTSVGSAESGDSSANSEINSLVEAISAPHLDERKGAGQHAAVEATKASNALRGKGQISAIQAPVSRSGSGDGGSVNIRDSVVPLRSIKVDPHDLNTTPQWGELTNKVDDGRHSTKSRDSISASHPQRTDASKQNIGEPSIVPGGLAVPDPAEDGETATDSAREEVAGTRRHSKGNFYANLPPRSSASSLVDKNSSDNQPAQPLRILVVEDDAVNRMILKKRLGMEKHSVILAVNGEEGVHQFEEVGQEIDVILMDLQMPICNGQDACRRIRAIESKRADGGAQGGDKPTSHICNGRIPIFAVSATLDQSMREEMCEIGFDAWTLKPIDFGRLRLLLNGITLPEKREAERWQPGHVWEKGGFLV